MDITQALKSLIPNCEFKVENDCYEGITWFEWNTQPLPSEEEVNREIKKLKIKKPMELLRKYRDKLLAETDWVTMRAYSTKTDVPTEWITYQQALRDLPNTATPVLDPTSPIGISGVDWPVKPQ